MSEGMNTYKPTLYFMVGISGSGKSTKAKDLSLNTNAIIVSSDKIREEICGSWYIDRTKNEEVFKIFHSRIKKALIEGRDVIADATNISIKSRRCAFEAVKNIDCYKVAYVMVSSLSQSLDDNINREYPVPHHVIERQMMNFQIPFYNEGFDEILLYNRFNDCHINNSFFNDCLLQMKDFDQKNPYHNMKLGEHCDFTYKKFIDKNYPYWYLMATRIHDIGKLFTQSFDEDGVAHYYQHENVGCYYILTHFEDIKASIGIEDGELLDMLFLINYHMLPNGWKTNKSQQKWKKIFGNYNYQLLFDFNECDKSR